MEYQWSVNRGLIEGVDQHLTANAFTTHDSTYLSLTLDWNKENSNMKVKTYLNINIPSKCGKRTLYINKDISQIIPFN